MEYVTNGGVLGELTGVRRRSPHREDSDDDQAYFESEDDENTYANCALQTDLHKPQQKPPETQSMEQGQNAKISAPATLTGLLGSYDEEDEDVPADVPAPAVVK